MPGGTEPTATARSTVGVADGVDGVVQPDRGSDTIRRDNPREQGAIGLAQAVAWFTRNGYEVSLPISEAQRYDLVVEDEHGDLKKVEVKTTTHRNVRGRFVAQIKTCGGNQSWNGTVKRFDPDEVDILYVLTDSWDEYVIPTDHVRATTALTLGADLAPFRVVCGGRPEEQLRLH